VKPNLASDLPSAVRGMVHALIVARKQPLSHRNERASSLAFSRKWDRRAPWLIDAFHKATGDDRVVEHRSGESEGARTK